MFPRLALLPIGLFLIWCFVCSRWYVCHIKLLCDEIIVDPDPPVPTDNRPLVFVWDDAEPIVRSTFNSYKDSIVGTVADNQLLEITGEYFESEKAPEGFSNMGLARAAKIKALFIPPLDSSRIVELSKLIVPEPEGVRTDTFVSASFKPINRPNTPVPPGCIKENDNTLIVCCYPYGLSQKEVNLAIEECLPKFIEFLKQSNDEVLVVGHTDDAGSDAFNIGLGQRRADHIKGLLVKNGVASDRIRTDSKGEHEPRASNGTEEGTRLNRRVVVTLIEK